MNEKPLYLEQRIALVRRVLNERTKRLMLLLPLEAQGDLHDLVMGCIAILNDGEDIDIELFPK